MWRSWALMGLNPRLDSHNVMLPIAVPFYLGSPIDVLGPCIMGPGIKYYLWVRFIPEVKLYVIMSPHLGCACRVLLSKPQLVTGCALYENGEDPVESTARPNGTCAGATKVKSTDVLAPTPLYQLRSVPGAESEAGKLTLVETQRATSDDVPTRQKRVVSQSKVVYIRREKPPERHPRLLLRSDRDSTPQVSNLSSNCRATSDFLCVGDQITSPPQTTSPLTADDISKINWSKAFEGMPWSNLWRSIDMKLAEKKWQLLDQGRARAREFCSSAITKQVVTRAKKYMEGVRTTLLRASMISTERGGAVGEEE
ncbi:hypothetical protein Tco_0807210 [Tanacetum coccineum]